MESPMEEKSMTQEMTAEEREQLSKFEDPDAGTSDQFKWDEELQREILAMLLKDRHFLIQSCDMVQPYYFTNEVHQLIARILFKHFSKYKILPQKIHIAQEMEEEIANKKAEVKYHYRSELNVVYDHFHPGLDSRDYLTDKITNFAKKQAVKTAFYRCREKLNSAPEEESTWDFVYSTLRDAMTLDRDFGMGLDYFASAEERYARMAEELEKGEFFTCGLHTIDTALMCGGLKRGEMASWIGLSGAGKSLALVRAAVANMNKGKKVLYVSLEIDQDAVAERFDAQLADPGKEFGVSINNLLGKKDVVIQSLREYVEDYDDKMRLIIKQFPPGEMGVSDFRAYFSQIVLRGFKPDLVIVDYIGEMKDYPNIPTWDSRYRIVRDLRRFAVEESICMMVAMQPNKTAKEVIKLGEVIDDENLGDAYGQQKPLDAFWSINQMQIEKDAGIGRVWVIKHRHGKSRFMVYVEINQETLAITEISKAVYEQRRRAAEQKKEVTSADKTRQELEAKQMYARSKAYGEKKKGSKNPLASLAASDYSSEVDNIVKPVE